MRRENVPMAGTVKGRTKIVWREVTMDGVRGRLATGNGYPPEPAMPNGHLRSLAEHINKYAMP